MSSCKPSSSTTDRPNLRSLVWQHFTRDKSAQTAQCQKWLKSSGGSTKNLHDHLQKKNCIFLNKQKATNDGDSDGDDSGAAPVLKQSRKKPRPRKPRGFRLNPETPGLKNVSRGWKP